MNSIVARDHAGSVVAALCASRPYVVDPATAEALATWRMAEFEASLGASRVLLKGDAIEIVQAFHKDSCCWERYGHLVDDAKSLLNASVQWDVSCMPCSKDY